MHKFSIFHKYFNYEKIIHALHLENGPLWNIAFFNLSKHKLNIYKTKFIETISVLVRIEETERISQSSVVLCVLIVHMHMQMQQLSIELFKLIEVLIFCSHQNIRIQDTVNLIRIILLTDWYHQHWLVWVLRKKKTK